MGRFNTPILSESAKLALEQDFKTNQVHCYRMRCQVILLKSTGRKSEEVGEITGMTYVSVNAWVKRYKDLGIEGLINRSLRWHSMLGNFLMKIFLYPLKKAIKLILVTH